MSLASSDPWAPSPTFEEFLRLASRPRRGQRKGQAAFNCLVEQRPDLAEMVRGRFGLDPFYKDDRLPGFYEFLERLWVRERYS